MNRQVSCLSTLPKMPRKQENKESEQEFQFKSGENRAASTRRRLLGREGTLGPHLGGPWAKQETAQKPWEPVPTTGKTSLGYRNSLKFKVSPLGWNHLWVRRLSLSHILWRISFSFHLSDSWTKTAAKAGQVFPTETRKESKCDLEPPEKGRPGLNTGLGDWRTSVRSIFWWVTTCHALLLPLYHQQWVITNTVLL